MCQNLYSQVSVNFLLDKRNAGHFGLPPWRVSGFLRLKPTSLGKWDHKNQTNQKKQPNKPTLWWVRHVPYFLLNTVSVCHPDGKSFHNKLARYIKKNLFPCISYPGPSILLIIILAQVLNQVCRFGFIKQVVLNWLVYDFFFLSLGSKRGFFPPWSFWLLVFCLFFSCKKRWLGVFEQVLSQINKFK